MLGLTPAVSIVSGGLCSIGGILPDVDSENGHSVREVMGFAAAVVPLMLIDHLRQAGLNHDQLVLAGGSLYVVIRFGIGEILKRYTVHRGMWHSIPAAIAAGLATSFICSCDVSEHRLFKAGGMILGYLVHLLLDEFYSIQWYRGRLRLKKSFGTAMKIWGPDPWANATVFANLAALLYLAIIDPTLVHSPTHQHDPGLQPREAQRRVVDSVPIPPTHRR